MNNKILNKPNQLISILPEKSINLIQQKSYNIFLRKAQREVKFNDKYKNIDKERRYIFKMPCKELKERAGLGKKYYKEIKEELKKLIQIIVEVVDKENKSNWAAFSLLESVEKIDDTFEYSLNWRIVKALKGHNFFTSLDLIQIKELNSKYSVAFYELAVRYKKYKIPKMTIEELRKRTSTENKYKQFYNFRRRVLDVACKEISEKTDIRLSYITEKKGRRIAYIDFTIEKKKQELPPEKEVEFEPKGEQYSEQTLKLFNLLPENERVATNKRELAKLLEDHSFRYLKADIEYTKETKPQKFMAFLKSSCQAGHYSSAEIEKEERKEKKAQERREEERKRQELKEKIEQKAHEKALVKYDNLSSSELEDYAKNYNSLPNMLKKKVSKKNFVLGALEDEIKEGLEELSQLIL